MDKVNEGSKVTDMFFSLPKLLYFTPIKLLELKNKKTVVKIPLLSLDINVPLLFCISG